MWSWLFELFCKHHYARVGVLNCTFKIDDEVCDVPVYFFECQKCGKRKIVRDHDELYKVQLLKQLKMWLNREVEFTFNNKVDK